jgi:hypothetical protein
LTGFAGAQPAARNERERAQLQRCSFIFIFPFSFGRAHCARREPPRIHPGAASVLVRIIAFRVKKDEKCRCCCFMLVIAVFTGLLQTPGSEVRSTVWRWDVRALARVKNASTEKVEAIAPCDVLSFAASARASRRSIPDVSDCALVTARVRRGEHSCARSISGKTARFSSNGRQWRARFGGG